MVIYNYNREKRANRIIFILAVTVAILITGMLTWRTQGAVIAVAQEQLADNMLRFHILANSDTEEDQTLKIKVRDQVLVYLKENMPAGMSVQETKEWMRMHTGELEDVAQAKVHEERYAYPVNVAVTTCYFSDRTYGDVTYPAGNYEALRIEIGAAKGHNWWCVLYPGLAFEETTNVVVPGEKKQQLKHVLTADEYSEVTAQTDFKIKWYFGREYD